MTFRGDVGDVSIPLESMALEFGATDSLPSSFLVI